MDPAENKTHPGNVLRVVRLPSCCRGSADGKGLRKHAVRLSPPPLRESTQSRDSSAPTESAHVRRVSGLKDGEGCRASGRRTLYATLSRLRHHRRRARFSSVHRTHPSPSGYLHVKVRVVVEHATEGMLYDDDAELASMFAPSPLLTAAAPEVGRSYWSSQSISDRAWKTFGIVSTMRTKGISGSIKPGIKSFATSARVLPVFIHSFQPVSKTHFLRHSQAQSRIANLQIGRSLGAGRDLPVNHVVCHSLLQTESEQGGGSPFVEVWQDRSTRHRPT
jgi:hypothetical protein